MCHARSLEGRVCYRCPKQASISRFKCSNLFWGNQQLRMVWSNATRSVMNDANAKSSTVPLKKLHVASVSPFQGNQEITTQVPQRIFSPSIASHFHVLQVGLFWLHPSYFSFISSLNTTRSPRFGCHTNTNKNNPAPFCRGRFSRWVTMVILDRRLPVVFTVLIKCPPRHSTRKDDQDEFHHLLRWIRPKMQKCWCLLFFFGHGVMVMPLYILYRSSWK